MMKKTIWGLLAGMLFLSISCKDNEEPSPTPPPPSPEVKEITKFLFEKSKELEVHNVSKEEAAKLFGQKMKSVIPTELQIKKDSLFVLKPHGIVERYKVKWNEKKLFLHNSLSEEWEYCGEKIDEKRLLLNIGFYQLYSKNELRQVSVSGQAYDLKSCLDFSLKNVDVVWVKSQHLFKEEK